MASKSFLVRMGALLGLTVAALATGLCLMPGATAQSAHRPSVVCAPCSSSLPAPRRASGRPASPVLASMTGVPRVPVAAPTTAGARVFVIHGLPRASGLIPWHGHRSTTIGGGLDLVADLSDGHVDLVAADMSIPARGPDLVFQRTWDSTLAQLGAASPAGQGWVSSLTPRVSGPIAGTLLYTDEGGAAWQFPSLGASAAAGGYATPPGLSWQFVASPAGYTLTDTLSGEVRAFDARGRYLFDSDSYGNRNTLQYQGGLPIRDLNDGGRALRFSYQHGLLNAVASPLWVTSGGTQGQQVAYRYDRTGHLIALTRGAGTPDALTTRFAYHGALLVGITTPDGYRWQLDYDAQGRLIRTTTAGKA